VKGKLLVAMVNDPQPTDAEPGRFGGKSLTWYGRWTYKFEEAVRQGAAGILLIHTTPSASYPWSVPLNSFSHEQFHLAGAGNALRSRRLLGALGPPGHRSGQRPAGPHLERRHRQRLRHRGAARDGAGRREASGETDADLPVAVRRRTGPAGQPRLRAQSGLA